MIQIYNRTMFSQWFIWKLRWNCYLVFFPPIQPHPKEFFPTLVPNSTRFPSSFFDIQLAIFQIASFQPQTLLSNRFLFIIIESKLLAQLWIIQKTSIDVESVRAYDLFSKLVIKDIISEAQNQVNHELCQVFHPIIEFNQDSKYCLNWIQGFIEFMIKNSVY